MDPQLKKDMKLKSFDFALSTSKQLIALSTAVVAFSVTFSNELFGGTSNVYALVVLFISWLVFLYSIWEGVSTIMGLTGSLNSGERTIPATGQQPERTEDVSIYDANISKSAKKQINSFVAALLLTIVYAGIMMYLKSTSPLKDTNAPVTTGSELRIIRHSTYSVQDSIRTDTLSVVGKEPN